MSQLNGYFKYLLNFLSLGIYYLDYELTVLLVYDGGINVPPISKCENQIEKESGSMILPELPVDVLSVADVIKRCQVTDETVAQWKKEGLSFDDNNTIPPKRLIAFLVQSNYMEELDGLYGLKGSGKTMVDFDKIAKTYLSFHEYYYSIYGDLSDLTEIIRQHVEGLKADEKKLGLSSPDLEDFRFMSLQSFTDRCIGISVEEVEKICGIDRKTVMRWKSSGLKMWMTSGKLYTTLVVLINYFINDKKKKKYIVKTFTPNFDKIIDSIRERRKVLNDKRETSESATMVKIKNIYSTLYDPLKNLPIEFARVSAINKSITKISAIELISEEVNNISDSSPEIAILEDLVKRLKILGLGRNSSSFEKIESGISDYFKNLRNIIGKLLIEQKGKEDSVKYKELMDIYANYAEKYNYKPLKTKLLPTGLTHEIILKYLIKSVPLRRVLTHLIPKEILSPDIWVRTYIFLGYVDSATGSILLKYTFKEKIFLLPDVELFSVCAFLSNHVWYNQRISSKNRILGVSALMNIGTDAIYKRIRVLKHNSRDSVIENLIYKMLNTEYFFRGIPDIFNIDLEQKVDKNDKDDDGEDPTIPKCGKTIDKSNLGEYERNDNIGIIKTEKSLIIDSLYPLFKDTSINKIGLDEYRKCVENEIELVENKRPYLIGIYEGLKFIIDDTTNIELRDESTKILKTIQIPHITTMTKH